jgi:hypothetical protein
MVRQGNVTILRLSVLLCQFRVNMLDGREGMRIFLEEEIMNEGMPMPEEEKPDPEEEKPEEEKPGSAPSWGVKAATIVVLVIIAMIVRNEMRSTVPGPDMQKMSEAYEKRKREEKEQEEKGKNRLPPLPRLPPPQQGLEPDPEMDALMKQVIDGMPSKNDPELQAIRKRIEERERQRPKPPNPPMPPPGKLPGEPALPEEPEKKP